MLLDAGLDTGPVYLCEPTEIAADETVTHLYDRLAEMGAKILIETVEGVANGTLNPVPQNNSEATFAPILKKEDGFIDWHMPAEKIHNRVRAFNPWPGTVAKFRGRVCKILKTSPSPSGTRSASPVGRSLDRGRREAPGEGLSISEDLTPSPHPLPEGEGAIVASRTSLAVVCGDGALLEILSIQPEGRKAVSGTDFANGVRLQPGEKFESLMDN
jgi:methionyl-tRNA formyltransferase